MQFYKDPFIIYPLGVQNQFCRNRSSRKGDVKEVREVLDKKLTSLRTDIWGLLEEVSHPSQREIYPDTPRNNTSNGSATEA
jgi:hypothetical protein